MGLRSFSISRAKKKFKLLCLLEEIDIALAFPHFLPIHVNNQVRHLNDNKVPKPSNIRPLSITLEIIHVKVVPFEFFKTKKIFELNLRVFFNYLCWKSMLPFFFLPTLNLHSFLKIASMKIKSPKEEQRINEANESGQSGDRWKPMKMIHSSPNVHVLQRI